MRHPDRITQIEERLSENRKCSRGHYPMGRNPCRPSYTIVHTLSLASVHRESAHTLHHGTLKQRRSHLIDPYSSRPPTFSAFVLNNNPYLAHNAAVHCFGAPPVVMPPLDCGRLGSLQPRRPAASPVHVNQSPCDV